MADFVSGSKDAIIFWESQSFTRKLTAQPFAAAMSPSSITWNSHNTNLVVVPQQGDRAAMCDTSTGNFTWTHFKAQSSGDFTCGCLLRNTKFFASGSSDSIVRVWDIKNKTVFKTCKGHSSPVRSICRSHRDNWLVSGGQNGAIAIHEMDSTSSPVHIIQEPHSGQLDVAVTRLKFSYMDRTRFGSVSDGGMTVWSAESKQKLMHFSDHSGRVTDMCFSPSNNLLALSVGSDSCIRCYDITTRKPLTSVVIAPAPLTSATLLREGFMLIVGTESGTMYGYDLRNMKKVCQTLYGHTSPVTCISQGKSTSSSSRSSPRSPGRRMRHSKGEVMSRGDSGSSLDIPSGFNSPAFNSHDVPLTKEEEEPFADGVKNVGVARVGGVTSDPPSKDITMATHIAYDDRLMATPMGDDTTNLNSIFSPVDPNLVTPLSRPHPIATVAMATSATLDSTTYTYRPTHAPVSESTAVTPPPSSSSQQPPFTSSSTPITTGPAPACATPSLSVSTETSELFSPLESSSSASKHLSSRQPVASPLLIAHTKANSAASVENVAGHVSFPKSTSEPSGSMQATRKEYPAYNGRNDLVTNGDGVISTGHVTEALTRHRMLPDVKSLHSDNLDKGGGVDYPDSTQHTTEPSSVGDPFPVTIPTKSHGPPLLSAVGVTISGSAAELSSELMTRSSIPSSTHLAASRYEATPTNDIQMKFIRNMVRDAHEETREILHDDIRAINVDFMKVFHVLVNQVSVLTEKVDKLAEDVAYLKSRDPLYVSKHMPKH